jgi:hypothetical protein
MESEETKLLSRGIAIRTPQHERCQYRQKTEDQNGNCRIEVPGRRASRRAEQQQSYAACCDESACDPAFTHVLIVAENW